MYLAPRTFLSACRITICVFMSFTFLNLYSQEACSFNLNLQWQNNFGGSNSEIAKNTRETADGGYIIAGHTLSDDLEVDDNYGGVDYWLVKIDQFGNPQWDKNYGGSSTDLGVSVIPTTDNGYLFLGGALSNNEDISAPKGSYDIWLLKLDSDGDILWDRSYGGTGNDRPSWMEPTADGGYIISGTTSSDNGDVSENKGVTDALVIKLDSDLNVQWSKVIGGTDEDFLNRIQQTADGGYVATGGTFSFNGDITNSNGLMDALVFKLDANGNLMWLETIGGTGLEWGNGIMEAANGDIVLTGATDSNDGDFDDNEGFNDLWVSKLDASGNLLWSHSYGGLNDEMGSAVQASPTGGFLIAGHSEAVSGDVSSNNGILDIWVLNLDTDGNLIEDYNFGGTMSEMSEDMRFTKDGGLLISGFSESNDIDLDDNKGQADFWLLKFEALSSGLEIPDFGEDKFFCVPQNVFLNAGNKNCSNCTYQWSDGDDSSSRVIFAEESAYYGVTITDQAGCSVSEEINIVLSDLKIEIQSTNPSGCLDNGSILVTATGGTGTYSFRWDNEVDGPINQDLPGGIYSLTISDGECDLREMVTLENQTAEFPVFDLGEDQSICGEETIALEIDLEDVSIMWSTGENSDVLLVTEAGTYMVTVTNSGGCSTTDEVTITEAGDLEFSLGEDVTTCEEAYVLSTNLEDHNHLWSTGETASSISVTASGLYQLTLTAPSGCSVEEQIIIDFSEGINFNLGEDVITCAEDYLIEAPENATSYLWNNEETSPSLLVTESGEYSVTISSQSNCTSVSSINIEFSDGLDLNLGEDLESCEPVLLNPGISQSEYKWSNNSTGVTLLAQETGVYSVTVTNNEGCTAIDSIFIEIFNYPGFALPDTLTSCESINFDFSDAPYEFNWSNGATGAEVEIDETGDYMITVTADGGCSITEEVFIDITSELLLDLGEDMTACENVILEAGLSGLEYEWSNGSDTEEIEVTETGTYSLVVSEESGCSAEDEIFIEVFPSPTLDLGANLVSCSSVSIDAYEEGLEYLWSDGTRDSSIVIDDSGEYVLIVSNEFGCTAVDTIEVSIADELSLELGDDLIACEDVLIDGGEYAEGVSFLWSDGSSDSSLNVTSSGIYSLTISDGIACTAIDSIEVQIESPIEFDLGEDLSGCGQVMLDPQLEGVEYLWSNGETGETLIVETSGIIGLTITSEAGCESKDSIQVNITEGFDLEIQNNSLLCAGDDNGFINLTIGSESDDIIFNWEDGATSEDRNDLSAGVYNLTISDDTGCEQITSIEITEPAPIEIELLSITHISCENNIGEINVEASGGVGDLTYLWDNINGQAEQLNVDQGGYYVLTVVDENNCSVEEEFEIFESDDLVVFVDSISGNPCPGLEMGYLRISVVTGTPPYTYEVTSSVTGITDSYDQPEFINLPSGQYAVKAIDATGCSSLLDFVIEAPEPLDLNLDASGSCGDFGFAFSEVVGGIEPYVYSWSTGDTTKFVTDLMSGEYALTVVDDFGCSHDSTFIITNFEEVLSELEVMDVACHGADDGSITVKVTQGEEPFVFDWNNGLTEPALTNLGPATYTVFVTDANGCTVAATGEILEPTMLSVTAQITDSENGNDGSISITPAGGVAPYQIEWLDGSTETTIENLGPGAYSVSITDVNDCLIVEEFIVEDVVSIDETIIEGIAIFPNPSSDKLNIKGLLQDDVQITIVDMLGQKLLYKNLMHGNVEETLSLKSMLPGVYFLKFETKAKKSYTHKIIKL